METNITITITVEELKHLVTECVDSAVKSAFNDKRHLFEVKEPEDDLMNVQEVAAFLRLAMPTIYSKVKMGELPYKKRGKRLYFSRKEIREYLDEGSSHQKNHFTNNPLNKN